jgi:hypothetical protein
MVQYINPRLAKRVILPRRVFLKGLLTSIALVSLRGGPPAKVSGPELRWREGFVVLNGAELKASDFPDLFDVFGHHFGGEGATFCLPTSSVLPNETLISVDATQREFFYPAHPSGSYPDTLTMHNEWGWVWQDFFAGRKSPPRIATPYSANTRLARPGTPICVRLRISRRGMPRARLDTRTAPGRGSRARLPQQLEMTPERCVPLVIVCREPCLRTKHRSRDSSRRVARSRRQRSSLLRAQ